jgi:hypothetical protein
MVILTRKIGERIVVPNSELVITLLAVEDKTIRLDISAPARVDGLPPQSETDRFRTLLDRSDLS